MSQPFVVLITGANSGIGYETAKALMQSTKKFYHIFFTARHGARGRAALSQLQQEVEGTKNQISFLELDVTSDDSIKNAVQQVTDGPGYLDALINNAGTNLDIAYVRGKCSLRDAMTRAYDVNVTGAHVASYEFMPLLLKSTDPRLLFVTGLSQLTVAATGNQWPTPPQPSGWPKQISFETVGYRCSKTALSMLIFDWHNKVKADGVKVFGVGPGMVSTNLGSAGGLVEGLSEKAKADMGLDHASTSGSFFRKVIEGERDADVGKLIVKDGFMTL